MEEINEDPIIKKDLEVEKVETIKEEIKVKIVKDLNVVKLVDCMSWASIILVEGIEPKCIDFIGFERFDAITLYLVWSSSCSIDNF